jgi:hypothetical protein
MGIARVIDQDQFGIGLGRYADIARGAPVSESTAPFAHGRYMASSHRYTL